VQEPVDHVLGIVDIETNAQLRKVVIEITDKPGHELLARGLTRPDTDLPTDQMLS
jgi:hypothetical protein